MLYNEIDRLFTEHGDSEYFGEPISQSEHALQAAFMAAEQNAPESLIVAALLHDIGHLLHNQGEDIADAGVDTQHELAGEQWLSQWFGPAVTEPIKLHVPAKRYLCAVDPPYLSGLSPASVQSLSLQGGPYTAAEVRVFEENPYFQHAIRLRKWDDGAKIPGLKTPVLADYKEMIERQCRESVPLEEKS